MVREYKDHPRPQFVRPDWESLEGTWDFAFDDGDAGRLAGWQGGFIPQRSIRVPFAYESPMSGIGDGTAHPVVWYQRRLSLNRKEGKTPLLHFEGCDYRTDAWLNGQYLGGHTGGYTRFSFDLADAAQEGDNLLVVRVEDPLVPDQVRGKQRWVGENFGCWYVQTTGIWKTVWLERVPALRLTDVRMTPHLDDRAVEIACSLNRSLPTAEIETEITLRGETVLKVRQSAAEGRTVNTHDLCTKGALWAVESWSPDNPILYDVTFRVYRDGQLQDEVFSYFAMRKIGWENGVLTLNNSPLYLRMVLDQGYWKDSHLTPPDPDALRRDVELIKQMGFNGARKHQKIEDERWLYWCDVLGLLVWQEMPSPYDYTYSMAITFMDEWRAALDQHYNHPCIMAWVPFNESWGIPSVFDNGKQQRFTLAVRALTKLCDPFRPVISNDGWEHTDSDIVTLHDYEASGRVMGKKYTEQMENILNNRIAHGGYKYAFANGYGYHGQPLMISEYGGVAIKREGGWGYNDMVSDVESCLARIAEQTAALRAVPGLCGFCYTQLTDVQQEINGILYEDHTPKLPLDRIRDIMG